MTADPTARLGELVRQVTRHRDAVREFGLAGYVTKVEQHESRLQQLYEQIRAHCEQHGLTLPPDVPRR